MKKSLLAFALMNTQIAISADLFFSTAFVEVERPSWDKVDKYYALCSEKGSIDIQVQQVKTNRSAIDAKINQEMPSAADIEKYYLQAIDEILEMADGLAKEDIGATLCSRELVYTPNYLGHYNKIEQFSVSYYEYAGGAHGVSSESYYLFDEKDQRLTVNTLFTEEGVKKLPELLETAYRQWWDAPNGEPLPAEEKTEIDADYLKAVKEQADNFYFAEKGLIFSYAPYAVGPYAAGQVELLLPYEQLTGLVKAEYLP